MGVTCLRILENGCITDGNLEEAFDPDRRSPYWLDIQEEDADAIVAMLRPLGIEAEFIGECATLNRRRVAVSQGAVLVSFPVHYDPLRFDYLRILSLPNLVVTIHAGRLPGISHVREDFARRVQLHAASTAALVYEIFEAVFNHGILLGFETRDRINEFAAEMDERFASVDVGDLLALKHQLGRLEITFEDQLYCVAALLQLKVQGLNIEEQRQDFREFEHELETALRSGSRLERRLQDLHQYYVTCLQEKTNRRLNILTMIQSIFVPMTVIAGIYGMNFKYMPELDWPLGYPAALLAMAAIAVGEIVFFYRSGWFEFLQSSSSGEK